MKTKDTIITAKKWNEQARADSAAYKEKTGLSGENYWPLCHCNYGYCLPVYGGYVWKRTKRALLEYIGMNNHYTR